MSEDDDLSEIETSEPDDDIEPEPKSTRPRSRENASGDQNYWQRETGIARREAQRHRTNLRNVEADRDKFSAKAKKLDSLLSEFGIEDVEKFDPKTFAGEYKDLLTSHQHTRRKFEIHKAATTSGADPELLMDSNSFMSKVIDLNPDDKKFGESLSSLITETLEKNPVFSSNKKSSQAPSSSAATPEIKGQNGELPITDEQLKTMSSADIVAARKAGKLKHLGF